MDEFTMPLFPATTVRTKEIYEVEFDDLHAGKSLKSLLFQHLAQSTVDYDPYMRTNANSDFDKFVKQQLSRQISSTLYEKLYIVEEKGFLPFELRNSVIGSVYILSKDEMRNLLNMLTRNLIHELNPNKDIFVRECNHEKG